MIINMSGGGVDTSNVNATASDVLKDKIIVNADGEEITGTIETKTASDLTVSGATVTVPKGYYANNTSKSVAAATQATPSITVSTAGLITASATQTAGYVAAGTKSATKQLTVQAAKTVTPSTSVQTAVASGRYTTGAVTVAAIPSTYKQLNYSVVGGTTQPTGAANKIWVNTSTAITSHVFSSTQPTGATGKVWFQVGTSSPVAMDIIAGDGNETYVYPVTCKQYVSGAWVAKTAKTYIGSAWVDWVNYLYNSGSFLVPFVKTDTTSFGGYSQGMSASTARGHVNYNTDHVEIYVTEIPGGNNSIQFLGTQNAIDVSKVNTVKVNFSEITITKSGTGSISSQTNWVVVSASSAKEFPGDSSGSAYKVISTTQSATTISLDVSSLSSAYIAITAFLYDSSQSITAKIKSIILE